MANRVIEDSNLLNHFQTLHNKTLTNDDTNDASFLIHSSPNYPYPSHGQGQGQGLGMGLGSSHSLPQAPSSHAQSQSHTFDSTPMTFQEFLNFNNPSAHSNPGASNSENFINSESPNLAPNNASSSLGLGLGPSFSPNFYHKNISNQDPLTNLNLNENDSFSLPLPLANPLLQAPPSPRNLNNLNNGNVNGAGPESNDLNSFNNHNSNQLYNPLHPSNLQLDGSNINNNLINSKSESSSLSTSPLVSSLEDSNGQSLGLSNFSFPGPFLSSHPELIKSMTNNNQVMNMDFNNRHIPINPRVINSNQQAAVAPNKKRKGQPQGQIQVQQMFEGQRPTGVGSGPGVMIGLGNGQMGYGMGQGSGFVPLKFEPEPNEFDFEHDFEQTLPLSDYSSNDSENKFQKGSKSNKNKKTSQTDQPNTNALSAERRKKYQMKHRDTDLKRRHQENTLIYNIYQLIHGNDSKLSLPSESTPSGQLLFPSHLKSKVNFLTTVYSHVQKLKAELIESENMRMMLQSLYRQQQQHVAANYAIAKLPATLTQAQNSYYYSFMKNSMLMVSMSIIFKNGQLLATIHDANECFVLVSEIPRSALIGNEFVMSSTMTMGGVVISADASTVYAFAGMAANLFNRSAITFRLSYPDGLIIDIRGTATKLLSSKASEPPEKCLFKPDIKTSSSISDNQNNSNTPPGGEAGLMGGNTSECANLILEFIPGDGTLYREGTIRHHVLNSSEKVMSAGVHNPSFYSVADWNLFFDKFSMVGSRHAKTFVDKTVTIPTAQS